PLTPRVAVNRVWQTLFGRGIVTTPDNFGYLGDRPTHPELLDWLAVRFMEEGWSMKKIVRQIVLSRTYQLSSEHHAVNYKADPDFTLAVGRPASAKEREKVLAYVGKGSSSSLWAGACHALLASAEFRYLD